MCGRRNGTTLACACTVFCLLVANGFYQYKMTSRKTGTAWIISQTAMNQSSNQEINVSEMYLPNGSQQANNDSGSLLTRCVRQTGLFNQSEVDMITTQFQKRPNLRERWPLVFTHIPKTGGTTVAKALNEIYNARGCGMIGSKAGKVNIRNGTIDCFVLDVSSGWNLFPWGIFSPNETHNLPPRHSIIGVEGHIAFGVCRFFDENCSYTTLLREPIDRYVSHVRWECQNGPSNKRFCNSSLADYTQAVMRGDVWFYGVDNHQTRMLSGDNSKNSLGLPCFNRRACITLGFRQVGPTQLKRAIWNLAVHYPVFGVLDDLDTFSSHLKMIYGYDITFEHANRGTFSQMNLNLTAETRKDLETLLAPDLGLYQFVKCVLDAKNSLNR
jgi:hypothetical protein